MELLQILPTLLLLALGSVAGSDQGETAPEITKDSIRQELETLSQKSRDYVDVVKQLVSDMKADGHAGAPSLHSGISDAFLDGAKLYQDTMEFVEEASKHLWEELQKHNNGAQDGFLSPPLHCSNLHEYGEIVHQYSLEINKELAWIYFSKDFDCIAKEFGHIYNQVQHLPGNPSIEDALWSIEELGSQLFYIKDSCTVFYFAARFFFPDAVPDFGQDQEKRSELANQLIDALMKRILDRRHHVPPNGKPHPGNGPPPHGNGHSSPPPPTTTPQSRSLDGLRNLLKNLIR